MRTLAIALVLLLFAPTTLPAQNATTYDELLASIRKVRQESEARVQAAVEQEKVRESWETGKLIDEHILLRKERAEYGKQVIIKLAIIFLSSFS